MKPLDALEWHEINRFLAPAIVRKIKRLLKARSIQPPDSIECKHIKRRQVGIWTDNIYRCHPVLRCVECKREFHEHNGCC